MGDAQRADGYLKPGTRVRLDAFINDDDETTPEFGIVVHCWLEQSIGMFDCYVAFFGPKMPAGQPADAPYILRYAATSLTVLPDAI